MCGRSRKKCQRILWTVPYINSKELQCSSAPYRDTRCEVCRARAPLEFRGSEKRTERETQIYCHLQPGFEKLTRVQSTDADLTECVYFTISP